MNRFLKIGLIVIGSLVTLWITVAAYFVIAPGIIGPKADVESYCSAIEPGTTPAELDVISGDHGLIPIFEGDTVDNGTVQVDIQHKNGWVCICQVEMQDGKVLQPNEVFCSD